MQQCFEFYVNDTDCSFINNTGLNENNYLNNLLDNVNPEFENEYDIISHLRYCTDVDFQELLQESNCDICIVNLNCLNLKTRYDHFKLFLADTDILTNIMYYITRYMF